MVLAACISEGFDAGRSASSHAGPGACYLGFLTFTLTAGDVPAP